jgi:hypothetical protein
MDERAKIRLSDVLGGLVTSVSYGRNVSDVQALRIALNYKKNSLLEGLPVPRLRLSQVSISLPMILTEVIPGEPPKWNNPAEITQAAVASFQEEIDDELKRLNYLANLKSLTEDEKDLYDRYVRFLEFAKEEDENDKDNTPAYKSFEKVVRSRLKRAFLNIESEDTANSRVDTSIRYMVGETVEIAFRNVMSEFFFRYAKTRIHETVFDPKKAIKSTEEIMESEITERMISDIRPAAEAVAIRKPSTAPDIYVEVNTDNIKNAGGGPDAVTRLNIVMHEEGLEWLSEEQKGLKITRLMPE